MARQKPDEVQEEVDELEPFSGGEEDLSGSSPHPESDDNTKDQLANVIGNEPADSEELNIGNQIDQDEKDISGKRIDGYKSEETGHNHENPLHVSNKLEPTIDDPYKYVKNKDIKKKK